jgi:flagellar protein FliO/FliZ
MTFGSTLMSLLWFGVILAAIPLALWLLKRTPAGGSTAQGLMRTVAVLPLSPSQRIVTVEVGRGDARRWLVLGVTGQQIHTLHEMAALDDVLTTATQTTTSFAQLLSRLQGSPAKDGNDAR